MSSRNFNSREIEVLEKNPYVDAIKDDRYIMYSDSFKRRFVKEYIGGKSPTQIFKDAGFDTKILGRTRIKSAARWTDGSRGEFNEHEIEILEKNQYVDKIVARKYIIYTDSFKMLFMREYIAGKGPTQIFRDAGFDTKILGNKRIERAAARWKEAYFNHDIAN